MNDNSESTRLYDCINSTFIYEPANLLTDELFTKCILDFSGTKIVWA